MLFVSLHRYIKPRADATAAALDEHLRWNWKQYQEGRFLFSGPIWDHNHVLTDADRQLNVSDQDKAFVGMIVFRADSLDDARALMAQEPFVKHGFRVCEVFEWEVHQAFGVGPFSRETLRGAHDEHQRLREYWQDQK